MIILNASKCYYRPLPREFNYILCSTGIYHVVTRGWSGCTITMDRILLPEGWVELLRNRDCRRWAMGMATAEEAERVAEALEGVRYGSKRHKAVMALFSDITT